MGCSLFPASRTEVSLCGASEVLSRGRPGVPLGRLPMDEARISQGVADVERIIGDAQTGAVTLNDCAAFGFAFNADDVEVGPQSGGFQPHGTASGPDVHSVPHAGSRSRDRITARTSEAVIRLFSRS